MDTVITVIQVFLTLGFAVSGLIKLCIPYARLTKLFGASWVNDFKPNQVRLIGVLEVCAAVGLIVPLFLHSLTMLTSPAAVGLALVMAGAMATHLRRAEYRTMVVNLIYLGLALFVAYGKLVGVTI